MPNYSNVNEPYIYEHSGTEIPFSDNRFSFGVNHLLPVYIDNIQKIDFF